MPTPRTLVLTALARLAFAANSLLCIAAQMLQTVPVASFDPHRRVQRIPVQLRAQRTLHERLVPRPLAHPQIAFASPFAQRRAPLHRRRRQLRQQVDPTIRRVERFVAGRRQLAAPPQASLHPVPDRPHQPDHVRVAHCPVLAELRAAATWLVRKHPVRPAGGFVFVSGQLPIGPDGSKDPTRSIEEQTRLVLGNVREALAAAGAELHHVVKVTAYLTTEDHWAAFNSACAAFFGEHRPARAVAQVNPLHYGFLVEVDAVAYVGNARRQDAGSGW